MIFFGTDDYDAAGTKFGNIGNDPSGVAIVTQNLNSGERSLHQKLINTKKF